MMRRVSARFVYAGLVALLVVGAAVALVGRGSERDVGPREQKPRLLLLTTLPLVFPEEFKLEGGGSEALSALESRYRVVLIAAADRQSLAQGRLLLMAHALPQTAEALVDLDRWVRNGGRLLLLADPKLDWPSERALGDLLRPPPSFADAGLLAHWGLRLGSAGQDGEMERQLGDRTILVSSPGQLHGRRCAISNDQLVARCALGKGKLSIVADADFLRLQDADGDGRANLEALLAELADLER